MSTDGEDKRFYTVRGVGVDLLARNAHPWEPFPFQRRPTVLWEWVKLVMYVLRWKMVASFVKHRSALNGKFWFIQ